MQDTRIGICCYDGDQHQVAEAMPWYQHHGLPITVLSPADAPAADIPGTTTYHGGGVGYIGQVSLDRQADHLAHMLTYPENWFLMHDSDSVILEPTLPDYLYQDASKLWSNQVFDDIPEHQHVFLEGWPHVAFQPPYFMHRSVIERMVAVKDDPRCKASEVMPFIDYYMVQLAMVAGIPWARFKDCISCPIAIDLRKLHPSARDVETYGMGYKIAWEAVGRGCNVLHSIKNHVAIRNLAAQYQAFKAGNPMAEPQDTPAPHVGGGPASARMNAFQRQQTRRAAVLQNGGLKA